MVLGVHLVTISLGANFFYFVLIDARIVSENPFKNAPVNISQFRSTEGYKTRVFNQSSNECSCGWQSRGCQLVNGKKVCDCEYWYSQKGDECRPCNCGFAGTKCHFNADGEMNCTCIRGFSQTSYGKCESCDCGYNSIKCEFQGYKKVCKCNDGYKETSGECKLCDCGFNSISCSFDWSGVGRCICENGYFPQQKPLFDKDETCTNEKKTTEWKKATYIITIMLICVIVTLLIVICYKKNSTSGTI